MGKNAEEQKHFLAKKKKKLVELMRTFGGKAGESCSVTKAEGRIYHKQIISCITSVKTWVKGFPGGAVVENLPANAGDTGSSPGLGRSHMPRSN